MRQTRGFTLIELMVSVTILAILVLAGLPDLFSYLANSKLRESANTVLATVALARNEAIKRDSSVNFTVSGQVMTISKVSPATTLQTLTLPDGVSVTAAAAKFDSAGRLSPFGSAVTIATSLPNKACSADIRCPAVLIEAGGVASICPTGASNGVCL